MKIRQGFVSNSSSSSFIVNKKIVNNLSNNILVVNNNISCDTNDIKTELKKVIDDWNLKKDKEKKEEIKEVLESKLYHLFYLLESKIKTENLNKESCSSYIEITDDDNFIEYDEIQYFNKKNKENKLQLTEQEINKFTEKYLTEYNKKHKKEENYTYIEFSKFPIFKQTLKRWIKLINKDEIAIVEYADDNEIGALYEHYVMPKLQKHHDIISISHH